jgi:hypothetical protein
MCLQSSIWRSTDVKDWISLFYFLLQIRKKKETLKLVRDLIELGIRKNLQRWGKVQIYKWLPGTWCVPLYRHWRSGMDTVRAGTKNICKPNNSTKFAVKSNFLAYYSFQFLAYYSVFFVGQGSVCPGGYAGLSQGWLWEHHVPPICSPVGLHLPSRFGASIWQCRSPPVFPA